MSMICGLRHYRAGGMEGLEDMLAALPGHEAETSGKWTEDSVGLVWRGRGGVGQAAVQSPRFDAASGLAITASIRLDRRDDLCEALGIPGGDRAGLPDSALVLRSYARWGRACPERLFGDFAFALWNAKTETLFCARDHAGVRPLYYALAPESVVFASDIGAVLAAPGVSGDLDERALVTRLTYGARSLGDRTCYRAVRRLLPGHALTVERGSARVERWWRPEDTPPLPGASDDDLAAACLALLSEAVRDRVRDAGSVGAHVSGGLDSSAVAVLAARELRRRGRPVPSAFAWHPPPGPGIPDSAAAEYNRIEAVGRAEGLQVFYRPPTAHDVAAFMRRDGIRCDEGSLVHEEVVQRAAAAQGVEVLLSGWGGDEGVSFNGRGYFPQLLRSGRVRELWRELGARRRRPLAVLLTEAALPLVSPGAARMVRELRRRKLPFRRNVTLVHPAFARRVRPLPAGAGRPRAGVRAMQLYLLQHGHLSRRMEGWAASGARHGIEYRYPLLDRRVLEFALGMPPEQYRRGRWSRWLMRRALDPVLPPEVCWNADKRDPARFEPLRDTFMESLPGLRHLIEERPTPPSRARYLDMPRLLEQLDPERWRASGGSAPVANALRFLDF
jgi:asparagine synthase (glutamine-hydrolysing)